MLFPSLLLAVGISPQLQEDTCVRAGGKTYCANDGTLKRDKILPPTEGHDALGAYTVATTTWAPIDFRTSVFTYHDGATTIYRQMFPTGLNGTNLPTTKSSRNLISSQFPAFKVKGGSYKGYLHFKGQMMGEGYTIADTDGGWNVKGGLDAGPLMLFSANESIVISAASNFMTHSLAATADKDGVVYGLMGDVQFVPAGYTLDTIVSHLPKGGLKPALDAWGAKLLTLYGKTREGYENDATTTTLQYSTDNGAWYYYKTEPGMNYQDTMILVKKYADAAGLPYRGWLMDSWWYYKGADGAVKNWTARPDIFPDGIEAVTEATKWPIVAHNRYWAAETDYAKQNGGQYNFIIDGTFSVPDDQKFWDDLIHNATKWGIAVYEQDWLHNELEYNPAMLQSPTLGRDWLMQMGSGAQKSKVYVQYCMSYSRHMLQSVEIPAVTQARASDDYHPGSDQWKQLGVTGPYAYAIAIRPTKDNFWTTDKESGRYGNDTERYNRLQSAVSTLSAGPVAPSDEINKTDVALVMRSCDASGQLLQPDYPATLVTKAMLAISGQAEGPKGEVWSTTSTVSGLTTTYLIATQSDSFTLTPAELMPDAQAGGAYVAWETNSTDTVLTFDDSHSLAVPKTDKWSFNYWTVAPVLKNGWVILGEITKWVSMSAARFTSIDVAQDSLKLELAGATGEEVQIAFLKPASKSPTVVKCTFASQKLTLTMPDGKCS